MPERRIIRHHNARRLVVRPGLDCSNVGLYRLSGDGCSELHSVSKYRAIKTTVDGMTFDSKKEAARYMDLRLLEKAGLIESLERQPVFVLAPSVKYEGAKRATPALRYSADFTYFEWVGGKKLRVVDDCKGALTTAFKIKRHLMKAQFGIEVRLS